MEWFEYHMNFFFIKIWNLFIYEIFMDFIIIQQHGINWTWNSSHLYIVSNLHEVSDHAEWDQMKIYSWQQVDNKLSKFGTLGKRKMKHQFIMTVIKKISKRLRASWKVLKSIEYGPIESGGSNTKSDISLLK